MIHLYSGDGKGKTSIATGMAVRAVGAGRKVVLARFMKGGESAELAPLKKLGVRVIEAEKEFPFYNQMTEAEKAEITVCHNRILAEVLGDRGTVLLVPPSGGTKEPSPCPPSSLVILDEITYPVSYGLIDVNALKAFLAHIPEGVELVMTGRNPADFLIEAADYHTELVKKAHPYDKGIQARYGIEF